MARDVVRFPKPKSELADKPASGVLRLATQLYCWVEVTVKLLLTACCRDSHTQPRKEKKLFILASGGGRVSLQKGMVK